MARIAGINIPNHQHAEIARYVKYIDGHKSGGLEDAYWTLMNTTEFLTRH